MTMLLPVSPLPITVKGHDPHFKFIYEGQQLAYEQAAPANIDQEVVLPPSCSKVTKQNNSAQQDIFAQDSIAGIRHGDVEDQWFQDTAVIKWHPLSQYSADDYGCHTHSPACQSPVMAFRDGSFEVSRARRSTNKLRQFEDSSAPLSKIKMRHSEDSRLSIGHFRDMCKIISLMPEGGGVD